MKELDIEPICIGKFPLPVVFERVFSNDMLTLMHGDSVKITSWENNKRIVRFSVNLENVPMEIKRFFCGSKLRVTSRQILHIEPNLYSVKNKIKMHFLFSEFFHVKPEFYLEKKSDGGVYFSGKISHSAVLPPPLNSITETFMKASSEREITKYKENILHAFIS